MEMANVYSVRDGSWDRFVSMICTKCGEKITDELYLRHDIFPIRARGNEQNEMFLYHRHCSDSNPQWMYYQKKVLLEKLTLLTTKREEIQKQLQDTILIYAEIDNQRDNLIAKLTEILEILNQDPNDEC